AGLTFSNPRVQRLRRLLGRRSSRYEEGVFVVEGLGLLQQAVDAGWAVVALYLSSGASVDLDVDQYPLAPNVMERVASTESPQPVLAVVSMRATELPPEATFVLVADRMADLGNDTSIILS